MKDFENDKNLNEENQEEKDFLETSGDNDISEQYEVTVGVADEIDVEEPTKSQKITKEIISWVVCIVVAVVVALIIRSGVFTMVKVDGNSMNPTLQNGERLFTRIIGYTPDRGDVVIFHPRSNPKVSYVKRAIALEGDCIKFDSVNNVHIMKKGSTKWEILEEPYISCQTVEPIDYSMINCFESQNGDYYRFTSDGSLYKKTKGSDAWNLIPNVKCTDDMGNLDYSVITSHVGALKDYFVYVEKDHIFVMGDNRSLGGSFDSRKSGVGQVHVDSVLGKASFRWWPISEFGSIYPENSSETKTLRIVGYTLLGLCIVLLGFYVWKKFIRKS